MNRHTDEHPSAPPPPAVVPAVLEEAVLLFPVAVTALVAATLLVPGGRCAPWQWWLPLAGIVPWIFFRARSVRRAVKVLAGFAAVLLLLALGSRIVMVCGWFDSLRYHSPGLLMMLDGWNPVWQASFEGMAAGGGIDPAEINAYHLIAMPKAVWYFDAAAYWFLRNPFNLFFPLTPFLLLSLVFVVGDVFRGVSPLRRLAALSLAVYLLPPLHESVDVAEALVSLGLLVAMYDSLAHGRWNAPRLAAFTFWMVAGKQTGLIQAVVLWCLFGAVHLLARTWTRQLFTRALATGGVAVLLALMTSASPYFSAWHDFGHPFYPRATSDPERFPLVGFGDDFLERNEDAASMGRLQAYVNAFVSPGLARAWGRAATGRRDFFPDSLCWGHRTHSPGTPTTGAYRALFCASVVLLAAAGGIPGLFVALCMVGGTMALPVQCIGYQRYTPWALCASMFCLLIPLRPPRRPGWLPARLRIPALPAPVRAAGWLGLAAILLLIPALHLGFRIDDARAVRKLMRLPPDPAARAIPCDIEVGQRFEGLPPLASDITLRGNFALLRKRSAWLEAVASATERQDALPGGPWERMPCNGIALCADGAVSRASAHERFFDVPSGKQRLLALAPFLLRTYFATLPASCLEALHDDWQ